MKRYYKIIFFILFLVIFIHNIKPVKANPSQSAQRIQIYKEFESFTNIPWSLIGAIDQYERNTKNFKPYCPKEDEVISICIHPGLWSGFNNPNQEDNRMYNIQLFHGIGYDGNNDGFANRLDSYDRMAAFIIYLSEFGISDEQIKESLMDYYQIEKAVQIIYQIAKLFDYYETVDLSTRVFPIAKYYRGDYSNNFGTGRSYGGNRIHEGIDIFAHYGTPVVSTAYGVVEIMGWNNFGGYRIGIRDMYNTYQYYAHLGSYAKGLKVGDIVEPGQIIGYVGSTGYGKEGTSGKFPPHLHFGFYKFDGRHEWSFNPYSFVRRWPKVKGIVK